MGPGTPSILRITTRFTPPSRGITERSASSTGHERWLPCGRGSVRLFLICTSLTEPRPRGQRSLTAAGRTSQSLGEAARFLRGDRIVHLLEDSQAIVTSRFVPRLLKQGTHQIRRITF